MTCHRLELNVRHIMRGLSLNRELDLIGGFNIVKARPHHKALVGLNILKVRAFGQVDLALVA